jgi:hypothetical protein
MQTWRRVLMILAVLTLAWALPALGDARNDAERNNRHFLEQARNKPELFARLRNEYEAFRSLPPAQQERLRKLDRELQDIGNTDRRRLHRALERYVSWLERLPEAQRRRVESAPNEDARLKIIREIRQEQWVDRLPRVFREKVQKAQAKDRKAIIRELRQEEKRRRQEWQVSLRHWDEFLNGQPPTRKADLAPGVRNFIDNQLLPRLRADEVQRLKEAEDRWPDYLQTLVELNDKAFRIPGPVGPRTFNELPPNLRRWLGNNNNLSPEQRQALRKLEGKWPEFALKAVLLGRGKARHAPLAPAAPDQYPMNIQWFIHNQLDRVLTDQEKTRLKNAEGFWPRYPLTLVALARKHGLQVQGTALPGPPTYWDKYRAKAQDTTLEELLREFVNPRRPQAAGAG